MFCCIPEEIEEAVTRQMERLPGGWRCAACGWEAKNKDVRARGGQARGHGGLHVSDLCKVLPITKVIEKS